MTGRSFLLRLASLLLIAVALAAPVTAATKKKKPQQPTPVAPVTPPTTDPATEVVDHPRHALKEVHHEEAANGVRSYWFVKGDSFEGSDSPAITASGLDIEAQVTFNWKSDANSTLISQGDAKLGWAVHFVNGKPAITINYDGLHTTLCAEESTPEGPVTLRALLGLDGTLGINTTGLTKPAHGYAPMTGSFPRQPEEGLHAGEKSMALSDAAFPKQTPFAGDITFVRVSLLPATPVLTQETKTPEKKKSVEKKKR